MDYYSGRVYQIVRKIPGGKVATYGQIASLLGNKGLARVVGNILHNNPDGDLTPCYRVVNSQGRLAPNFGFGGPMEQKMRLNEDGIEVIDGKVDLNKYGWDGRPYVYTVNQYLKDTYGEKVYKVSLDGGFTCPNRDGTLDTRGCIFCSAGGSGDFASSRGLSVTDQIEEGRKRIEAKLGKGSLDGKCRGKLIAYFQAFTGTYAPVEELRSKFMEAVNHPDVVILSIATRPDCLQNEVLTLLSEINQIKPVWIELGLQTIHEETAAYIRRGYETSVYEDAVYRLRGLGIKVITHVILGLPGESRKQMLETVAMVGAYGSWGIKLQLLHVLEGTDLAEEYRVGTFQTMEMEEYLDLVQECIAILPPEMVVHRMTGDGDKKILLAPMWSSNKKLVLNELKKRLLFPGG